MSEPENANRPGEGAEGQAGRQEPTSPTVAPESAARQVPVTCDGRGSSFELPITEAINRFTTTCPCCGWCAWLPRSVWPLEPNGGPLRPTIGRRP